jgi:proline dehydrogenase
VSLLDRAVVRLLPAVPKPVVRVISSRYIAGERLDDAVKTVKCLNASGKLATIDVLGEEIAHAGEAAAIADEYLDVLDAIEREKLEANVSVKLTGFGLKLGYDVAEENLARVVERAEQRGIFVRIDMEDSTTTDDTLALYRELRANGHEGVGVVLQASLRRTLADVRGLHNVRVCKGIYVEPPELQFQDADEVRESFAAAVEALLDQDAYVAIATHDEWVLDRSRELIASRGLDVDAYEFQMLLGVRERLGDRLVRDGHRLRIYVPYGRHWYEYSVRRLQENPRVAGYVAADVLGRVVPGKLRL